MKTEFDDNEFSFAYPDGIENSYWNRARNKIILRYIKKYSLDHILDVGSGRGIVTDYLFRHGISVAGVELGNTTAISNSNVPIAYQTNALNLSPETSARNKVISLFDVIEHIEHPVEYMNELLVHFKNVEHLVITVPARKELWTNFDEYYGHFKRYDLHTVKNEMREIGFEVIECNYFFHSLYVLIHFNNSVTKKRAIQFKVPRGIVRWMHGLLGHLFYMEEFLTPGKLVGSSIICIAQKIKK